MTGEDITVKNNWDETRNQRVIIIYGNTPNDGQNRNAQMDIISSSKENIYYHALYLKEHAKNNYTQDKEYQNYIEKASNTLNLGIILFLQNDRYQNIVFTETTEENSKERYGILYLPSDEPNPEQYLTLNKLQDKLLEYQQILVLGVPYIEDGVLDNKITFIATGKEIEKLSSKIKEAYQDLELESIPNRKR